MTSPQPSGHIITLPCPECGEPITFDIETEPYEFGVLCRYEDHDRACGCQLDGLPEWDEDNQPIDHLIAQAKRIARKEATT